MEENSSTDDEVKNSCSEKTGSKKIKLNNGSSQDSLSDTGKYVQLNYVCIIMT